MLLAGNQRYFVKGYYDWSKKQNISVFTICIQLFIYLLLAFVQGKGVYQFVDKYGANVDGYR